MKDPNKYKQMSVPSVWTIDSQSRPVFPNQGMDAWGQFLENYNYLLTSLGPSAQLLIGIFWLVCATNIYDNLSFSDVKLPLLKKQSKSWVYSTRVEHNFQDIELPRKFVKIYRILNWLFHENLFLHFNLKLHYFNL